MIMDYEQGLTAITGSGGGENIRPVSGTPAYGTRPYFQRGAADLGIGEKDDVLFKISQAYNSLTSLDVALVGCDDDTDPGATTAGTNEVVIMTKTFLLAALTLGALLRVGTVPQGVRKKTLRLRVSTTGTTPTTGSMKAWISAGDDAIPANNAFTI